MDLNKIIEELKNLLIKYTSNSDAYIEENLTSIFKSFENKSINEDIESYAEFVLLGASLFEMKAKQLLPHNENIDWLDEVEIMQDKDLAFARLLQFKAFSEVGIAIASKIKNNENRIPAFKYYQTNNLKIKPNIKYEVNLNKFTLIANEVFHRYKTIEGFDHIDKDLPDLQESIDELLNIVDQRLNTSFEELVSGVNTTEKAIAFFLALLETIKWGFIKAEQTKNENEINIEKNYE